MPALVDQAPGQYALEDRPEPRRLAASEATIQITRTTRRGADWHILKGDVPAVAAGGLLANMGGHGQPVQLNLDQLWDCHSTLTTRLVDRVTTPLLMKAGMAIKVKARQLLTHHFPLGEAGQAYEEFGRAMRHRALEIVIQDE